MIHSPICLTKKRNGRKWIEHMKYLRATNDYLFDQWNFFTAIKLIARIKSKRVDKQSDDGMMPINGCIWFDAHAVFSLDTSVWFRTDAMIPIFFRRSHVTSNKCLSLEKKCNQCKNIFDLNQTFSLREIESKLDIVQYQ